MPVRCSYMKVSDFSARGDSKAGFASRAVGLKRTYPWHGIVPCCRQGDVAVIRARLVVLAVIVSLLPAGNLAAQERPAVLEAPLRTALIRLTL